MNHYDVLGVSPNATCDEIRAAYRRRASAAHPDREGGDTEHMAAINAAWATLGDPERRAAYDRDGCSDRPKTDLQGVAMKILADLFRDALGKGGQGALTYVGVQLGLLESNVRDRRRTAEARRASLARSRDKVRRRSADAENMFEALLNAALAEIDASLLQFAEMEEVNGIVREMLTDYEEDQTEAPPSVRAARQLSAMDIERFLAKPIYPG